MCSILTVGKIILFHPLCSVLSSLSSDFNHSHGVDKINLKPLVTSVMTGGPGPYAMSAPPPVKSGIGWTVISVPARGSCQLLSFYPTVLHSKRLVTTFSCILKKCKISIHLWLSCQSYYTNIHFASVTKKVCHSMCSLKSVT